MTVVHISLKLPLVQWAISLVFDLLFRCTEIHWMYKYHGAAGSNTVHHGKWEEGSGVLSLWLSHQSFQGGALSKELWGCSGHFHLTGPASHCHLSYLSQNPPFSSLILFSFPRTCFPASCLLFLSLSLFLSIIPVIQVAWVAAEGPGQSLQTSPTVPHLQCSSPCSSCRSWSFWFSCTSPTCRNDPLCQAQAGSSPSGPGQGDRGQEQGPDRAWLVSLSIILMANVFDILTVSIFFHYYE